MTTQKNAKRIAIVGGGISGLALAYRLSQKQKENPPFEITLLEAQDKLGGVIETRRQNGFLFEGGPDAFVSEKPYALNLCKELGLEHEVIPTNDRNRRSFIYKEGRLHPLPKGFYLVAPSQIKSLFEMGFLSWKGKLRMALEPWIPPRRPAGDESVASFIKRRLGTEALREIGQPMIGGIYTADTETLSLQATMPKLEEMEQRFGSIIRALRETKKQSGPFREASGPRYSLFLSLKGGMGQLVEALLSQLPGVQIKSSSKILQIQPGWSLSLESGAALHADILCLALPAYESARLVRPFAKEVAGDLSSIPYASVATLNFIFARSAIPTPVHGFGFVVPPSEKKMLLACTFSSHKFQGRAPEDSVLIRAFAGGALRPEILDLSEEELTRRITGELQEILDLQAPAESVWVRRYPESMPIYQVGHVEHVASIREKLKNYRGLFLTGNAYGGVGIPDCIRHADETAEGILRHLNEG